MFLTASLFCELNMDFMPPVVNCMTQTYKESLHTHTHMVSLRSWAAYDVQDPLTCVFVEQSAAVQTQTARVEQLQSQAATGKVSVKRVEKEQNVLTKMTVSHSHMTIIVTLHKLPRLITPVSHRFMLNMQISLVLDWLVSQMH